MIELKTALDLVKFSSRQPDTMDFQEECSITGCTNAGSALLSDVEKQLATKRCGVECVSLCTNHNDKFPKNFECKQFYCCNPFNKHKKRVKPHFTISLKESCFEINGIQLIPGKKIVQQLQN